ncbi:CrcB family protein [Microbacterium sp. ET2]|uniref:fluoride efflux transporter FluC n=1 Tax=Microbacterium albipurpureum TaxID=3050384 RepID=UPI00259CF381|nr:CrcB family protein [Microbacterium sp. ET2 (Ac-2212)]WJL97151.1 CrcB family protein [Microbacterium sp. ET2 (Ac-2212)]
MNAVDPLAFLLLVVAGAFGAGARYVVDALVQRAWMRTFPLGIFLVNVTGSLLLGVLTGAALALDDTVVAVIGVGFLGAYTTFSTVSVETVLFAERGRWRLAIGNVVGTLLVGVAAAGMGLVIGTVLTA